MMPYLIDTAILPPVTCSAAVEGEINIIIITEDSLDV